MRQSWILFVFVTGIVAVPSAMAAATPEDEAAAPSTPMAVHRVSVPAAGLRDELGMVLVGTALIGLAAAVRRSA